MYHNIKRGNSSIYNTSMLHVTLYSKTIRFLTIASTIPLVADRVAVKLSKRNKR